MTKDIVYILISYLIYGAYLVFKDFSFRSLNTPMYVRKPDIGSILFALFNRPLNQNKIVFIYPAKVKILGLIKLIIKITIISFILSYLVSIFK